MEAVPVRSCTMLMKQRAAMCAGWMSRRMRAGVRIWMMGWEGFGRILAIVEPSDAAVCQGNPL